MLCFLLATMARTEEEDTRRKLRREKAHLQIEVLSGGKADSIKALVNKISKSLLEEKDENGNTALHNAAAAGNRAAVEILMENNRSLLMERNIDEDSPLHVAAAFGHRETVSFLLSKISRRKESDDASSDTDSVDSECGGVEDPHRLFDGESGAKLVHLLISADVYDVALDILKRYPSLAWENTSENWKTPMETLANKPDAFRSGTQFGISDVVFYHFIQAPRAGQYEKGADCQESSNWHSRPKDYVTAYRHHFLLKRLYNLKLMHTHAVELLRFLIEQALEFGGPQVLKVLKSSTQTAVRLGIVEFVEEILTNYPRAILDFDDKGHSLFHQAVLHRQLEVFELLAQRISFPPCGRFLKDEKGNNFLHLAAEIRPADNVCGPAMHIQRELKWFKTAEKIVDKRYRNAQNNKGKTPREVFTEQHEEIVKEGGQWMKEIATNCATIAALIVTVAFAGCFTFPGGTDELGLPILYQHSRFRSFVYTNAVALVSSSISLLMFLKMLMSRCQEEDFLVSLPKMLIQSLMWLYVAIACILLTFAASLSLMISHFEGASGLTLFGVSAYVLCMIPISLFGFTYLRLWFEVAVGKVFM
ncbi:Ankyrin repeat-containing protein NPR4 [Linum perenne]